MKQKIGLVATIFVFLSGVCQAQQGLKGEYFNGRNFEFKVFTRTDAQLNFNWDRRPPAPGMSSTDFSIRWTGQLLAEQSGTYSFSAVVDDGIRLWVGGIKVIDAWGPHDHESVQGDVVLAAGQLYDLKVEYFNGILEGQIQLVWKIPSEENSVLDWIGMKGKTIEAKYLFLPKIPVAQPFVSEKEINPTEKVPSTELPKATSSPTIPLKMAQKPPAPGSRMKDTISKYTPKNILFEPGEPFILPESYPELNALIKLLKRFPKLKIQIDGHTDITGDPKINQTLSEDRASEVAYYLTENGIGSNRIKTRGFGATRPLFGKDSTRMYPQNRRVEFSIE